MPLAAVALDERAARRVTAAAAAAALQSFFCWLILHEATAPTALPASIPLQVTIFETARRLPPTTFPRKRRALPAARQTAPRKHVARTETPVAQPITVPSPTKPAPHGPIDWQRAIRGEVQAQESRSRASTLRFGFPRRPAPVPTAPQFGWDPAHTHRVEAMPQGGMLINLNDRCAVVVYGFLFLPFCRIGRIPANGQLFDHMRDRRDGRPDGLP